MLKELSNRCLEGRDIFVINNHFLNNRVFLLDLGVYILDFFKQLLTILSRPIKGFILELFGKFYTLSTPPIITIKIYKLLLIKGGTL